MSKKNSNNEGKMPFLEHFSELRKRIFYIFIFLIIGMGLAWRLSYMAIDFIELPLEQPTYITYLSGDLKNYIKEKDPYVYKAAGLNKTPKVFKRHRLHYSRPLEPFFIQVKVSIILGFLITLPFILFEIWRFINPALKRKEKFYLFPFLFFGTIFFIAGMIFMIFFIWPAVINFSLSYQSSGLTPLINISHYVNFALRLSLIFGLIFELPLVSALFSIAGILKPAFLKKYRKYALILSLIIAAFHADIVTMLFIAVPLYSMYEIGILISSLIWIFKKKPALAGA